MLIRCFVAYKIFSKILVHSLPGILSKIISLDQGRLFQAIVFSIISLWLRKLCILSIKKNTIGNLVLKIAMAKAYDWVDCWFLIYVMKGLGFSSQASKHVLECIKTPWYSIMMNDTYKSFFKSNRGPLVRWSTLSQSFYPHGRNFIPSFEERDWE